MPSIGLSFPDPAGEFSWESTKELRDRIEAWCAEATGNEITAYPPIELKTDQQDFPPLFEALPTASCKIVEDNQQVASLEYPAKAYQQTQLQVVTAEVMLLADAEPMWTANDVLYDLVDQLKSKLAKDGTLGGRVSSASPLYRVTYDGEVQYEDGTVCRMATFRMSVGQAVNARS